MPRQRLPANSEAAIRQQQQMRDDAEKQRRNIIAYYASEGIPAHCIRVDISPPALVLNRGALIATREGEPRACQEAAEEGRPAGCRRGQRKESRA